METVAKSVGPSTGGSGYKAGGVKRGCMRLSTGMVMRRTDRGRQRAGGRRVRLLAEIWAMTKGCINEKRMCC